MVSRAGRDQRGHASLDSGQNQQAQDGGDSSEELHAAVQGAAAVAVAVAVNAARDGGALVVAGSLSEY